LVGFSLPGGSPGPNAYASARVFACVMIVVLAFCIGLGVLYYFLLGGKGSGAEEGVPPVTKDAQP